MSNQQKQLTTTTGRVQVGDASAKDLWQNAEPFHIASDTDKLKLAVWEASQCKTQRDAALVYAKYGVPVIPCNWKKDKTGKVKKRPMLGEGGMYLATIEPAQIEQWWTQWPSALIGVPGGRRTGLWFLDVDTKEGHGEDGLEAFSKLEATHPGTLTTRAHKTGTGGLHYVFKWDTNRPVGCPTNTVPNGMEVKGDGGYVIFPPSPYVWNGQTVQYDISADIYPTPAPQWLLDIILGPRPKSKSKGNGAGAGGYVWPEGFGRQKLDEYCELIRTATEGHWDEACRSVYMFGRWVGGGAYDVEEAWQELDKAAKECRAPEDYPSNVERAFRNGVANPAGPFINQESFDDFYAFLPQHKYIFIPTGALWPASSIDDTISAFGKLKASKWLSQNRAVEQMTWVPSEGVLIRDRLMREGGWIEVPGSLCFNLYTGPRNKSGDATKAGPWIDLVKKVFPNDWEHILKWFAHRVQYPGEKINHALVLGSEGHGIGKDTILEPVKRAVGTWNFGEASPQQILGRFSRYLRHVILRVSEARDLGEFNRYQFYDHMKPFLASPPDALLVDEKYVSEYYITNCVGVVMTTNHKTTGIFLPPEDRRHFVAWSDCVESDFTEQFWNEIWHWYNEQGGDRHVAAFLAGYDLSGFNSKAPPPRTDAWWDIVDANRAPEEEELQEVFDKLGNPIVTTVFQIKGAGISNELFDWFVDKKNQRLIPQRLGKCGYFTFRNPDNKGGLWKIAGKLMMVYAQRGLEHAELLTGVRGLQEKQTPKDYNAVETGPF